MGMTPRLLPSLVLLALAFVPLAGGGETGQVGKTFPVKSLVFVDDPAPDLTGKPAIIEFWATFCAPCIKLIPHLNELYGKYKAKGLVVVGVSQDLFKEDIAKFREKTPINYPVAFDEDSKLGAQLGFEMLPWAFVIDRKGKIIWEGLSANLTEKTVEKALK
jgi:thiol-disulfide isomerase/thioredoxin